MPPALTLVAPSVLVMLRSADWVMVSVSLAVLLAVFVSTKPTGAVTVAVLVSWVPASDAGTPAVTTISVAPFTASVPSSQRIVATTSAQLPWAGVAEMNVTPAGSVSSTTTPVVIGAIAGWAYNRWARTAPNPGIASRMGVLLASGLIVGESLVGVVLAGLIVVSGNGTPLAVVGDAFQGWATVLGGIAFVGVGAWLYRWTAALARRTM